MDGLAVHLPMTEALSNSRPRPMFPIGPNQYGAIEHPNINP